jgi:DNA-binding transcriptional ArsR family regulator
MSLVAHKYTPSEMSEAELDATFAARGHTVDYLLKSLRDQMHSGTLSSFVVTGPRGAGKSTVIRMVALRLTRDPELSGAWLPVVFPEEQFGVVSLRDFLAAILRELDAGGLADAHAWLEKVEAESNDEQSEQLAVTGLREITRTAHKRLVVFVENLNLLLEECLDDQMKGTLRRLLMTDPFMMLIGSSVHVFDSLKSYDEAFFNYFGSVPLDRLSAEQVFELLQRRAEFDGNERFLRDFREQRAKIRAIVHLAGGNPRLILMLYELLSQRLVTTIVQCLRRLVDELTPLLKDEMENLPPQQRKIVHALMENGGTAQPTDLVERTRLPLNAITTQLKRLKDAQIVELLGGGKGRAANYTVPDKLFAIWYQMRYLNQNRRRIELFVEVLRIWFEAEERFATIQSFAKLEGGASPSALHEADLSTEYFAASLANTRFASEAQDDGATNEANNTLDRLAQHLATKPSDQRVLALTRFLADLASPEMLQGWLHAARRLLGAQPPETRQALVFLEPVCAVLEGGEKSLLDPLPPEQREFALNVLARFDAEKAPSTPPVAVNADSAQPNLG